MAEFIYIGLIVAVIAFWINGMQAHERAERRARKACQEQGVQFLDDTVSLARIRPARTDGGRATWRRHYRFEFSVGGDQRAEGEVILLGKRVDAVTLDMPDHTLYEGEVEEVEPFAGATEYKPFRGGCGGGCSGGGCRS